MPTEAALMLFQQARAHRAQADRVRELLGHLTIPDVVEGLSEYAIELECRADDLERQAAELHGSTEGAARCDMARAEQLGRSVRDTVKRPPATRGE